MFRLFLGIFLFFMCIDAAILIGDSLVDTQIVTVFDLGQNVTSTGLTGYYNDTDNTGTLFENVTGSVTNSTGGTPSGTLNPIDTILYPIQLLINFVNGIFFGGYILGFLGTLGFPQIFIDAMQAIIYGFLGVLTIIYYLTGRG